MTDREKLVELMQDGGNPVWGWFPNNETMIQLADYLISNGVTVAKSATVEGKWIPVSEPPEKYRNEYGELIPFLVCEKGTEYPFRGLYDGKTWGDGFISIYPTHWMPLPEPPKGE